MPFLMPTNPVVTVSGSDPIISTGGSTPIISIQDSTVDQKGAVQLEDSTTSTSIVKAATPNSVKNTHDHTTTISGILNTTKVDKIVSVDEEIVRFDGTDGDLQGYTSNAPTISDEGKIIATGGIDAPYLEGVKEENTGNITKGQIICITGAVGGAIKVGLADCDNSDKMRILGLAFENISQNNPGIGQVHGTLTNVDTRSTNADLNPNGETWIEGDLLYLSRIPGGLTKVRPISGRIVKIARTLTGSSINDDLYILGLKENPVWATAAANEDVVLRTGDSAGANKVSIRNYINEEKVAFDSYGNLTLSGTVDSVDIATFKSDFDTHDHNDLYYTESEVDDLITTVSGKLDDHNEMNNLDYASSGHTGFVSSDTLSMTSAAELTIVSGTVTCTKTLHRIDTEGDIPTDNLDTIMGGVDGDIIIIRAENGTRTVVLKDGTGNLKLGGRDLELIDTNMAVMLFYSGVLNQWLLIGDGGGSATASVSDDAFSSAWDGGTAVAPSRNAVYDIMMTKSDLSHSHDDRYYTESEVGTISGTLQINIDGKADTSHTHDDRYYTETEIDTISGSLSSEIDSDISTHSSSADHDGRYYTEDEVDDLTWIESDITDLDKYTQAEVDTISGSLSSEIDFDISTHEAGSSHDSRYYTETELDNGQLDIRYYTELEVDSLITTVSGKLDDHNEMNNLDYVSSGHTGFQPAGDYATDSELTTLSGVLKNDINGKSDIGHLHDDIYYTETELDAGQLDNRYYTESEVDTISGSLQNDIDTHGHVSTEIIVSKINTPIYGTLQEWINNTQSAGRMSGGDTIAHTDLITDVTVGGAGSGEFKVAGNQTSCYIAAEQLFVEESTNNDGYYTIVSGVVYSGGKTTIPVDEAVGDVADGIIYNGTVDVADGTGFIKVTDSDIGETVSFNIHAETSIVLTDITTNYLYVDYNTGTPNIKVTTDKSIIKKNTQFPISITYRNGPRIWTCNCGIYLPNKTRLDHDRILVLRGYERATGGEISEIGTRSIESTAGEFYRGTTEINTTSKNSTTDKLTTVYYDGTNWVWTEEETQIDNTYYNNIATGLVELGVSKYAVHWVCIDYLSNLYVVYGRNSYSLSEAQLAGVPSFMPVIANEFGIIAAKIIIQKTSSSFKELISAYTQLIPTATPTVHNNLSGLNDDDYKHLTAVNHTDLTDGGDCLIHRHDNRYYTETELDNGQLDNRYYVESEVDTISGTLQTDIDGKSDTSHLHDDRYYTETEVDLLITTFSGTVDHNTINNTHNLTTDIDHNQITNYQIGEHRVINDSSSGSTDLWSAEKIETRVVTATGTLTQDHSGLNNLDYASSGHTGFQPAGDYLTDSEFSTYSGTLQSQIDGKSDTSHLHDDRYYTESEIDTISGSLNTSKSDVDHSHTESDISDLDKYTQVEVDSLITTISGKLDDHNELNNLDYVSSGHTGFQPSGNYTTDSELTTLSGNLQTNIEGKDNYQSWSFAVDGVTKDPITSDDVLDFVGGDNITIIRSAEDQITISGSAGGGGGGLSWEVISIDTNAINGSGYLINAGGGNITLTLPTSPSEGDTIGVCDIYEKATTNVITIARNGNNIEAVAEDLVLDVDGSGFTSVYADAIRGWEIVSEIGPGEDVVSDTVYGTTWSGVTGTAPSKNAVYDEMELKADKGVNSDITSMTGLDDDGIPVAKVSGAIETAALAGAVVADNKLIRGDGGSRGIQESTIVVDDSGRMTNPSQPAFCATINTEQLNVTGDGTEFYITGAFWTERFDQGNNFLNGTFTAPVTGSYQLSGICDVEGLTTSHTRGRFFIVTSNSVYEVINFNFGALKEAGSRVYIPFALLVDMDASDTAFLKVIVLNGTKVVDVRTFTHFSGALIS